MDLLLAGVGAQRSQGLVSSFRYVFHCIIPIDFEIFVYFII
mgnify:CR=1 FL=1